MYTSSKKTCQNITCGKKFFPKSGKNTFCSRRCFKKDYYRRKKVRELGKSKYPRFVCPECGQDIILDFDPSKKTGLWLGYLCPGCHALMINVVEYITAADIAMGKE